MPKLGGSRCCLELGRTGAILHVQAFPDAWTCRRRSARSNVKSNGRAEGPLHGLRLKNKYIGFILCHFSQIGTKVGPNLRKE